MSIDSELDPEECWNVIRNYVPHMINDIISAKNRRNGSVDISSILSTNPEIQGNTESGERAQKFKEKEKSFSFDSDEEGEKEDVNKVMKWQKEGLESMINDIKEELTK